MALEVETGTGSAIAESYASVSQADARMTAQGYTNWSDLTTTEKEQALRRATVHMEGAYRTRWRGTRLLRAQALSWPRYGAEVDGWCIESTIVPTEIVNACIDLAFRAAAGELAADQSRAVVREKVGPIETEYSAYSSQATRYTAIDMTLAPFMKGGGAMVGLIRA